MITIDLSGKKLVVIGGARGIGAQVSITCARAGADVAWTYLESKEDLEASAVLEKKITSIGSRYVKKIIDCTDSEATVRFFKEAAEKWGQPDYLVYCAGSTSPVSFMDIEIEQWRRIVDINLSGAFIATKAVIPYMVDKGAGAIVLVGSAAISSGGGGRADYVSAKAGLEGLNRAITREFAPGGIRCNIVNPSLIDTDLLRRRHPDSEKRTALAESVPLRRLGHPEDIANAIVFLLSDYASYITGQSIYIDGGRTFCG